MAFCLMKRRMAREAGGILLRDDPDVDLHIHSNNSDGTFSPSQIVDWAKEKGLSFISITDHDGIGGLEEGARAARAAGIDFVNGIEMSTEYRGSVELHILGYGFDAENVEILRVCDIMRRSRFERNEKLLAAVRAEGFDIKDEDIPAANAGYISKPQIARAMIAKGYVKDIPEAFERVFDRPPVCLLKKKKTDALEAIRIITGAGGTAVLAHPMRIKNIGKRGTEEMYGHLERIVAELASHGMGGLECCYAQHTEEEMRCTRAIAERHGLISTRGSDFHGPGVTAD